MQVNVITRRGTPLPNYVTIASVNEYFYPVTSDGLTNTFVTIESISNYTYTVTWASTTDSFLTLIGTSENTYPVIADSSTSSFATIESKNIYDYPVIADSSTSSFATIESKNTYTYSISASGVVNAPTVNFSGTPVSGNLPLTVTFTDLTTQAPTSWLWDFKNDGTATSTQQNPTYTYTTEGSYSVKLTASNSVGTGTTTKLNYIGVYGPNTPIADVLVVAGGGGGGDRHGGGGGAGGYIETTIGLIQGLQFSVVVGAGGVAGNYESGGLSPAGVGGRGSDSSITGFTSNGGGGGGTYDGNPSGTFGSGGGGGGQNWPGISGTSGQGNSGGSGANPGGGGGGGAGGVGGNANNGSGGIGRQWLDGNYYAGGGGGAWGSSSGPSTPGGLGGGGSGAWNDSTISAGGVNTGGGGGATRSENTGTIGRSGGSGVVIVRYSEAFPALLTTGNPTVTVAGGYRTYKFTSSGLIGYEPNRIYSNYSTLVLTGQGTNGATNNTFIDSSSNNFTITRFGNTTQGSFGAYSTAAGYWSNYFDGSASYISIPNNSSLAPGLGDFTIECFVNFATLNTDFLSICQNDILQNSTADKFFFGYFPGAELLFIAQHTEGTPTIGITWTAKAGVWYHLAVVRQSGTVKIFVDGVQQTITFGTATDMSGSSLGQNGFIVGAVSNPYYYIGNISNFRYVVGSAVYTSSFTPTTVPLSSVTGTRLLTCQNNRYMDGSSNNFAVSITGNPKISPYGSLINIIPYSPTTLDGSMYFDGTGDYLTVPASTATNFETGPFTIEAWIYPTSISAAALKTIVGKWNGGDNWLLVLNNTNNVRFYYNGGPGVYLDSAAVITANQWTHIAVSRDSSNNIRIYVNGVLSGSAVSAFNSSTNSVTTVGAYFTTPGSFFTGYISNVRVVKGTAVYTSNFTPPTTPVTAISGTSILLNGANAGMYDATADNVAETVNVTLSSAQSKWSTTSMYFDGSGNITVPSSELFTFGSNDFTIEFWIKTSQTNFNLMNPTTATGAGYWGLLFQSSNLRWNSSYNVTNLFAISATAVLDNNWHHIAISRFNGTSKVFYDGVQQTSQTDNTDYSGIASWRIGSGNLASLNGYIQDMRISKGLALYTANFTPPGPL